MDDDQVEESYFVMPTLSDFQSSNTAAIAEVRGICHPSDTHTTPI